MTVRVASGLLPVTKVHEPVTQLPGEEPLYTQLLAAPFVDTALGKQRSWCTAGRLGSRTPFSESERAGAHHREGSAHLRACVSASLINQQRAGHQIRLSLKASERLRAADGPGDPQCRLCLQTRWPALAPLGEDPGPQPS